MKKKALTGLITVCLLLFLPTALAETRQGVIYLEGQQESIEETLFDSSLGFSFWYANQRLEAYEGEANGLNGVVVGALYSDGYMVLSMITEEDAEEYAEDLDIDIAEKSASSRVQMDIYREEEQGTVYFLTLIAEKGQYLRAVGEYPLEAAEGNAKYLQKALDSVTFLSEYDAAFLKELPGTWAEEYEGIRTVLTLEENGDASLEFSGTDGGFKYSYEGTWSYQSVPEYSSKLTFLFTYTDNPKYDETDYRVECAYAAYTESWVENDTFIMYLILNPPVGGSGVSPFEDVYGNNDMALHREQGPNMRVVKCKEYVSLREERSKSSTRLAKVPLGALVLAFPEYGEKNGFIYCVYHDEEGYILSEYLQMVE